MVPIMGRVLQYKWKLTVPAIRISGTCIALILFVVTCGVLAETHHETFMGRIDMRSNERITVELMSRQWSLLCQFAQYFSGSICG